MKEFSEKVVYPTETEIIVVKSTDSITEKISNIWQSIVDAYYEFGTWLYESRFGLTVLYTVVAAIYAGYVFLHRAFQRKAKKPFWKGYWKASAYIDMISSIYYTITAIITFIKALSKKD